MKGKLYLFLLLILMSLFFINGTQLITSDVKAAQSDKKPAATVTERTLYWGYKSYTIKFKNKSKDAIVTFKSSNKSVATVSSKGVIKPLNLGTATITSSISQNGKKYTSKIKVTVERPYIDLVDYKHEVILGSTYKYKAKAYGMDQKVMEWRSSDTSVATIDKKSGVLVAISEGTTEIAYWNNKTGSYHNLYVTVTKPYSPPVDSDKARYISGLDLSKETGIYYTTKKEEYIETSRFVLFLCKGIEIPVNIVELINYIMDMIEEETGYEYYAKWQGEYNFGMDLELDRYFKNAKQMKEVDPEHHKIAIVVSHYDGNPYGSYVGTMLHPENIKLFDGGVDTTIHELLHVAYLRNYKSMNGAFDEGFATYYTARILDKDDKFNTNYDGYFKAADYPFEINEKSIEQLYLVHAQGTGKYQLGFRLMHYITEKYGDKAFRKLHERVTDLLGEDEAQASTELVAKVIKEQLSEEFFVDFAKWHKLNRERFKDRDFTINGDWDIQNGVLMKYYGDESHVVIPDNVTRIGSEAFIYCMSLKTIDIPNTVTSIDDAAFFNCINLSEVKIPNSVSKLGEFAFRGCTSLKKVVLPDKLMELPEMIFMGCTSLNDINLPNSIKIIDDNAFADCKSLKNITLPENLERIGYSSFNGCTSLKEIYIPNSVKDLCEWAFHDCKSLTDIVLPKDLKKIENNLFLGCTSLKSIIIPDKVTDIGSNAFNFTSLLEVKIPKGVTKIGDYAFGHCKDIKIEIPERVKSIGKDTFYDCGKPTIYGKKGSYAERYAKNSNIKFIAY